MELYILGKQYSANQEKEIFSENEHGFTVTLTCNECEDYLENEKIVCNNVTEYHHLWDRSSLLSLKDRLACESNIHKTGWVPWDIFTKFKKIEVELADKIEDKF